LLGQFDDTVKTSEHNKVISFQEKNGEIKEGIINGGIYIIDSEKYIELTKAEINFSIEKDFFEIQCKKQNIAAFKSDGYFIDIGVPEDYLKAQNDFKEFKYR
jgi:D-glycero-alpha-D-manno-heptose 1-phosphate guanylyltransferase